MQKIKNIYHLFQAVIANIIYGFPSRKLKVIGVTGTDGKTTTTHLIAHILKFAGKKVSFVSTVVTTGFHVTTPSSFALQKLLKQSADNHDEYFVLETTSHALDQNRIWGIRYIIGIITNITHEHLDYHKTYEDYKETKFKLLSMSEIGIKNTEKIENIIKKIPDLTKFNQYNYSSAYTVCKKLGISDEMILNAMKTFQLPKGRLDLVYNKNFKIIIDFAHTPNAFIQLLPEVRKRYLKKNNRLIHVFGAAGLRDVSKRPLMGKISSKYSDIIIVTEEDYRTEDPKIISDTIVREIKNKSCEIIINRQKAINKAIALAKKDDVIIITGKGHEKSLCRGKIEVAWDEYKAVKNALSKKHDYI